MAVTVLKTCCEGQGLAASPLRISISSVRMGIFLRCFCWLEKGRESEKGLVKRARVAGRGNI